MPAATPLLRWRSHVHGKEASPPQRHRLPQRTKPLVETVGDVVILSLRWVARGRASQIDVDIPIAGNYSQASRLAAVRTGSACGREPGAPGGDSDEQG